MSVVVEEYNPEWPAQFQKMKLSLETYLMDVPIVSIEHVGSTSVPGLAAKPTIDIDIIVMRAQIQSAINALVTKGDFVYLGELGIADRHALESPYQLPNRNIYVCVQGAFQTRNHLAVRDTLRSNVALRDEYSAVKLSLAARGIDIANYVEAKSPILQRILKESGSLPEEDLKAIEKANLNGEAFDAVKTERLTLREFIYADVEGYYKLESQDEVARYQMWGPKTQEQARNDVVQIMQARFKTPRMHIELAVIRDTKFIGRVGVKIRYPKDGIVISPPHADMWFSFLPEVQGQGFATEAAKAFIGLLKPPIELEIECDPRNTGSWRLAERLGFERVSLTKDAFECKGERVGSLVYRTVI
ncbi:GrpB protein-domain-containing protein [Massariosphaeria phaeospora]|uniref:GrpB protein-domain-containing protein n=1 Tax=Massariosphaeria phaeospora TaxID=100035 RepID=A0A7C8IE03_9PLEO|nr:GrpB protein-domain-containing protein [Massariosphaeria phaeospora]